MQNKKKKKKHFTYSVAAAVIHAAKIIIKLLIPNQNVLPGAVLLGSERCQDTGDLGSVLLPEWILCTHRWRSETTHTAPAVLTQREIECARQSGFWRGNFKANFKLELASPGWGFFCRSKSSFDQVSTWRLVAHLYKLSSWKSNQPQVTATHVLRPRRKS